MKKLSVEYNNLMSTPTSLCTSIFFTKVKVIFFWFVNRGVVNPLNTSTSHYNCVGPQTSFAGGWVGGRGVSHFCHVVVFVQGLDSSYHV